MKFTLESASAASIRSIAGGKFQIGEEAFAGPLALGPDGVIAGWRPPPAGKLGFEELEELLDASPEVVLIGTGSSQLLPHRDLMFAMARAGVGLEMMDTPAAARTFNVLLSEGRSVIAVLYPTEAG